MLSEGIRLSSIYFKSPLLSVPSVGEISLHPVCLVSARRQALETSMFRGKIEFQWKLMLNFCFSKLYIQGNSLLALLSSLLTPRRQNQTKYTSLFDIAATSRYVLFFFCV